MGVAPTMRVPGSIEGTHNVYYAFRSLLLSVIKHNEISSEPIKSELCPGLGTGIGGMSEHKASRQMLYAYKQLLDGAIKKSARQRLDEHSELELLR